METKLNYKIISKILILLLLMFSVMCIFWIRQPYNRAVLLWKKGEQKKAISILSDEIKRKNDINSYQKLIEIYINSGDFNMAEKLIQQASIHYSKMPEFMFYSAMVNFYKGNFDTSLNLTEKVIAINQYFPEIYLLRGLIFENQKNFHRAKQEFIKELNNNPGNRLAWAKLKELSYAKNN